MNNSLSNDQDLFDEGTINTMINQTDDATDDSLSDKINKANDKIGSINKDLGSVNKLIKRGTVDTRSIVARARNSVLQFPIYVTQTLRVNEAQIISKMFERVYTTLVQTVLSQNQILDEEEANNLVFLKNYHSNLKEAADVMVNKFYKPIDEIDQMMYESIFYSQKLNENCTVNFSVVPVTNQDLLMENTRLLNEPLSGFIYLREATEVSNSGTAKSESLSEKEIADIAADRIKLTAAEKRLIETEEKKDKDGNSNLSDEDINKKKEAQDKLDDAIDQLKQDIKDLNISDAEFDKLSDDDKKRVNNLKNDPTIRRYSYKHGKFIYNTQTTSKSLKSDNKAIRAPEILKEADIKKINGMLPYTIKASFRIRTKDDKGKSTIEKDVEYIIGIKSVMHLIRTQDLVDDLPELVTGNIKSLQKVRYKTGEIKFSDYFFNVKSLKADAAKHINYNKRWLNTLKRLSEYDKMNGSLLKHPTEFIAKGNVPIPNGTLILAQPDITMLTNETGIDLSVVSNAKRLAKSLFLIGVVIVDSSAGTMKVLFPDSDTTWDVQSLAAIDAELSKTDNSQLMKELNRMVNR